MQHQGRMLQRRGGSLAAGPSRPAAVRCQASQDGGHPVKVTFKIGKQVQYGNHVVLTGSLPVLGSWSVQQGVKMTWGEGHTWACTVDIPSGTAFEYKYLTMTKSGDKGEWIQGGNLKMKVPQEAAAFDIRDAWEGRNVTNSITARYTPTRSPSPPPAQLPPLQNSSYASNGSYQGGPSQRGYSPQPQGPLFGNGPAMPAGADMRRSPSPSRPSAAASNGGSQPGQPASGRPGSYAPNTPGGHPAQGNGYTNSSSTFGARPLRASSPTLPRSTPPVGRPGSLPPNARVVLPPSMTGAAGQGLPPSMQRSRAGSGYPGGTRTPGAADDNIQTSDSTSPPPPEAVSSHVSMDADEAARQGYTPLSSDPRTTRDRGDARAMLGNPMSTEGMRAAARDYANGRNGSGTTRSLDPDAGSGQPEEEVVLGQRAARNGNGYGSAGSLGSASLDSFSSAGLLSHALVSGDGDGAGGRPSRLRLKGYELPHTLARRAPRMRKVVLEASGEIRSRLGGLTINEMRTELKRRGLPCSGNRSDLLERLIGAGLEW